MIKSDIILLLVKYINVVCWLFSISCRYLIIQLTHLFTRFLFISKVFPSIVLLVARTLFHEPKCPMILLRLMLVFYWDLYVVFPIFNFLIIMIQ